MHAQDVRTCTDASQGPDTRRRILILEQDEYLASLMHLLLYREGYEISAITSVEQLQLQLQMPTAPMMLFVSHHWLREDVPEVLEIISKHAHWLHTPVIMMMNYYDLDLIEHVSALGVTDHLLQPFEPSALMEMIQKYSPTTYLN